MNTQALTWKKRIRSYLNSAKRLSLIGVLSLTKTSQPVSRIIPTKTDVGSSFIVPEVTVIPYLLPWQACTLQAGLAAGRTEKYMKDLILTIKRNSINASNDFLLLTAAIIFVESNFNPNVVSSKGARGLMQIMPIGATEAERQCPKALHKYSGDWSAPEANIKYGTCLLQFYQKEVYGNTFLTTVLYNGGYKQLKRLEEEGYLAAETLAYTLKVHQFIRRCQ